MKYVYEVNGVATHKNHALFMEMRKWKDPEYAKGFLERSAKNAFSLILGQCFLV